MSDTNDLNPIGWGYSSCSYSHPVQIVAKEFQERWNELKSWETDFQNMTKEELVNFSGAMVGNWKSVLKQASELPDDGKKPSEFPPIKDTTKETIEHWNAKTNPS